MPAIIKFLGYNPLPAGEHDRRTPGAPPELALRDVAKDAAREIGVDQGTLARWERPYGQCLESVTRFLANGTRQRASRAGYPRHDLRPASDPARTGSPSGNENFAGAIIDRSHPDEIARQAKGSSRQIWQIPERDDKCQAGGAGEVTTRALPTTSTSESPGIQSTAMYAREGARPGLK